MRNPFIPIILFILSGATYFAFIAPTWEEVGSIKEQQESAQGTITQGEELKTLVADISEKVKRFEEEDPQGRIGAILPLEIDEILFLNDISALAGNRGLQTKGLMLEAKSDDAPNNQAETQTKNERATRTVAFSVSATYPQFVDFLREIEQNLVLLEIENIEFAAVSEEAPKSSGSTSKTSSPSAYDYSVILRTISVQ